jgi:hypothetical protein
MVRVQSVTLSPIFSYFAEDINFSSPKPSPFSSLFLTTPLPFRKVKFLKKDLRSAFHASCIHIIPAKSRANAHENLSGK